MCGWAGLEGGSGCDWEHAWLGVACVVGGAVRGWQAGGMYPTGMLTCFSRIQIEV